MEVANARWAATARTPLQRRTQAAWAAGRLMAGTLKQADEGGSFRCPAAPNFDVENYQAAPACGAELRVGLTALALSGICEHHTSTGMGAVPGLPVAPDRADKRGVDRELVSMPRQAGSPLQ